MNFRAQCINALRQGKADCRKEKSSSTENLLPYVTLHFRENELMLLSNADAYTP